MIVYNTGDSEILKTPARADSRHNNTRATSASVEIDFVRFSCFFFLFFPFLFVSSFSKKKNNRRDLCRTLSPNVNIFQTGYNDRHNMPAFNLIYYPLFAKYLPPHPPPNILQTPTIS